MRIVVLLKAVPVVGTERLSDQHLTDRSAQLEANGNDEYTLEKALKLTEAHGGEVTLLTVGPPTATDALRKGLAMGAARAIHVADDALRGSDMRATVQVLVAALGKLDYDLVFAGADTSDGQGGVVGAAVAARLGLPYLSYAQEIEPTEGGVRVHRISQAGYDVLEAPTPAVVMGTQLLGDPRYPSLRGIMQARSKPIETWSLDDLGVDPKAVGAGAATNRVVDAQRPPERAGATFVRESPEVAVAQIVDFLSARRLI
ncbi:MAG TPA: electron transfer flavoprotein subunit beta/FixA family protein [Candidatus Limnocylindrales bacterium]|nr:electron transfer flavoprotein subunit beta/FixA family protein [Candidatus Limnocylindrales bacterium]